MAKLYFRYGAMGSSKTANAIMVQYNYGERHQKVLMVKPQLENRDGERIIRSRSGLETECVFAEELEGMDLILSFVSFLLDSHGCSPQARTQLRMAVEELYQMNKPKRRIIAG